MHAGRHYKLNEFIRWTRREIYTLLLLAVAPTVLYRLAGWTWIAVPWLPVALVGTAAAFLAGFRNNATYNRLWEARQIYGAIVNASRSWGIMVKDFVRGNTTVPEPELHRQLIYRHIAWLTALRFQLREPRSWENMNQWYNAEFRDSHFSIDEYKTNLDDVLLQYLSAEERDYVMGKKNRATHIISLQSRQLRVLSEQGLIENFRYVELENMLKDFYDQQGRCERIKNFPYPRQFATLNLFFIRLFTFIVPFGMMHEFEKLGPHLVWLTIPFSAVVSWVFTSIEKIGEATENPFEGNANDVPITALSRTIEIDLREMLDEKELPPALQPVNDILM